MRARRKRFSARRPRRESPRRHVRPQFETLESRRLLTLEIEPNNTFALATAFRNDQNDVLDGRVSSINDLDYFKVDLTQGRRLSINTSNANSATFTPTLPPAVQLLDQNSNILFQSYDGTNISYIVPSDATYYVRIDSSHDFGTFVDSYGMSTSIANFSGVVESEPNDSTGTATAATAGLHFRGSLAGVNDKDFFAVAGTAGNYFALSFTGPKSQNPSVRLRRPDGTLLATDTSGRGLLRQLPLTGTYTVELGSDNAAGTVIGQYVRVTGVVAAAAVDPETGHELDHAVDWPISSSSLSTAVGELTSLNDVDTFAVNMADLEFHQFELEFATTDFQSQQNRLFSLYNEFGQLLTSSTTGSIITDFIDRAITPGRYFLTIQPTAETGLGPYAVRRLDRGSHSMQRDVPLYFLDFNQQRSHLGFQWVNAYAVPQTIPFVTGMVESRYDIFDVDVTLTAPPLEVEHVGGGYGNFGDIGAGGWGGGGFGKRRPDGDSVSNALATSWTTLSYSTTTTLNHELGHGTGLPHARSVLDFMAYGNVTEQYAVGTYFPQSGTDLRRRVPQTNNSRDYLDWVLQAGSQIVEQEPNDSRASAANLDPYLLEMRTEFEFASETAAGDVARHIASGDFNGDLKTDLLVANNDSANVSLLLGNGTFQSATHFAVGGQFWMGEPLAVGDFNKDSNLDFAVANYLNNTFSLFLGNGNGTFAAATTHAAGASPVALATADVNGDTRLDLVAASQNDRIHVMLGDGIGGFGAATPFNAGDFPKSLVIADLNGDSRLDVVTANSNQNNVSVLIGNGNGTFSAAVNYQTEDDPWSITSADFDQDNKLDLAIVNRDPDKVSVLFGNGNGTFQPFISFAGGNESYGIAAGDLNGDLVPDIVSTDLNTDSVNVYLSNGNRAFSRPISFLAGNGAFGVLAKDLTGDNQLEIATSNYFGDSATILLGSANNPRNDRGVVFGRIDAANDADFYSFTAKAGETFNMDVDSAEFQHPLDAALELYDATGITLAANEDERDRETGIFSADPYLAYTFAAAGVYTIAVRSSRGATGPYRFKLTPDKAFDRTGPRVLATTPNGGSIINGTRQLTFFFNDQLDPEFLTSDSFEVRGASTGVRPGTLAFNPLDVSLAWRANVVLPVDTYTVTLKGGATGIRDLRGNRLDGETDGAFAFPDVSGNGAAGGDFVMTFQVTSADTVAAVVSSRSFFRDPYHRGRFQLIFTDELDFESVAAAEFRARAAGPDGTFNTSDDRLLPLDIVYDKIQAASTSVVYAFTRGIPDPDRYRIEATLADAAGFTVNLAEPIDVLPPVPESALSVDAGGSQSGLLGSFVNTSLRSYATMDDWRISQTISGTRNDLLLSYGFAEFGQRSTVGISGGTDSDWDNFSVQWDGFITVPTNNTRVRTRSNDGSRMWIDINRDGTFAASGNEFINNNWGFAQGVVAGPLSVGLNAGTYPIRIQYENAGSGNDFYFEWITPDIGSEFKYLGHGPSVIDVSVQPNSLLTTLPFSTIDVVFSRALDPSTLTPQNMRVRRSIDATFFNADDTFLTAKNGSIAWDATRHRATFEATEPLTNGNYLVELNGDPGGIRDTGGRLLDGEYLDTYIPGNNSPHIWRDTPSGDGIQGGITGRCSPLGTRHSKSIWPWTPSPKTAGQQWRRSLV